MSCKIFINNPGIIGPGDTISGKAICRFTSEERIRKILCKFRCQEQTHWTERRGKNNVRFTGSNNIIVADRLLIGEGTINPGVYEYTFAFALPPSNIPSSYSHEFGSIRYFIEAYVDRPFAFDYKDEVTLHVESVVSSNASQLTSMMPLAVEVEKEVGCCCCSELITMNVITERDAYKIGDVIHIKVNIINKSNVEIEAVQVQLLSNIQYTTHSPHTRQKLQEIPLAISTDEGVNVYARKSFNFSLKIPQTTMIHNFSTCGLFKYWCSINVEAILPLLHKNFSCQSNIHLSHVFVETTDSSTIVPVGQAPAVAYPANQDTIVPTAPMSLEEDFSYIDSNTTGLLADAPPSYEDALKENVRH